MVDSWWCPLQGFPSTPVVVGGRASAASRVNPKSLIYARNIENSDPFALVTNVPRAPALPPPLRLGCQCLHYEQRCLGAASLDRFGHIVSSYCHKIGRLACCKTGLQIKAVLTE